MTNDRKILLQLLIDIANCEDECRSSNDYMNGVANAVTEALEALIPGGQVNGMHPLDMAWDDVAAWAKDELGGDK